MYMNAVIIVAGGKGLRMGGDIPKQFLPIHGKPILMHTIERFLEFDPSMQIVLVLPKDQQDYWAELCKQHAFAPVLTIADGGTARFHSVKNGLAKVHADVELVGVHDGVALLRRGTSFGCSHSRDRCVRNHTSSHANRQ